MGLPAGREDARCSGQGSSRFRGIRVPSRRPRAPPLPIQVWAEAQELAFLTGFHVTQRKEKAEDTEGRGQFGDEYLSKTIPEDFLHPCSHQSQKWRRRGHRWVMSVELGHIPWGLGCVHSDHTLLQAAVPHPIPLPHPQSPGQPCRGPAISRSSCHLVFRADTAASGDHRLPSRLPFPCG